MQCRQYVLNLAKSSLQRIPQAVFSCEKMIGRNEYG